MGSVTRYLASAAAGAALIVIGVSAGHAADEAENIIKYRQNVMKSIGGHIANIAAVAKGQVTYIENVSAHARALADMTKLVAPLFPEGTDTGKTNALPAIWTDRAKFDAALKANQAAAAAMVDAAATNDLATIQAALGKLGKSCGGCHKPFRKKKE